jgi:hypothetical protein
MRVTTLQRCLVSARCSLTRRGATRALRTRGTCHPRSNPSCLRCGACHQCGENIRLLPCFPQNGPLVLVVSFSLGRRRLPACGTGNCRSGLAGGHGRRSAGMWRDGRDGLAGHAGLDDGRARRYQPPGVIIWFRIDVTDTTRRGLPTVRHGGIRWMRGHQGPQESGAPGREIRCCNAEALGPGAVGAAGSPGTLRPGLRSGTRSSQAGALG